MSPVKVLKKPSKNLKRWPQSLHMVVWGEDEVQFLPVEVAGAKNHGLMVSLEMFLIFGLLFLTEIIPHCCSTN